MNTKIQSFFFIGGSGGGREVFHMRVICVLPSPLSTVTPKPLSMVTPSPLSAVTPSPMMSITALCWVDTDTDTGKMDMDTGGTDKGRGGMDTGRGLPLVPRKGVLLSGNKGGTVKLWTLVNTPPS
jgi:hypothetical protein